MTSADPSVKALLGGTGGDLNEVRGAHQSESPFFSKELTWELMGSPPGHVPGTVLDHPAPALTQLKPSRQEGCFPCFTPGAFLRPPIPSFSPHWTNPSLQPLRMALSSESHPPHRLLLLRVLVCLPLPGDEVSSKAFPCPCLHVSKTWLRSYDEGMRHLCAHSCLASSCHLV